MKKYRVRPGSIADKAVRLSETLERRPWSYIVFTLTWAMIFVVCGLVYNSVVPMYQ